MPSCSVLHTVRRRLRPAATSPDRASVAGIGTVWLRPGTTDDEVFRQVFSGREYELRSLRRYAAILAHHDAMLAAGRTPVIVDAGANIGAASLWFSAAFPRAHVVAVEPDAGNAAMCRRNCTGRPAIDVVEAAIGSMPGGVTLHNPSGKAWAPRSERSAGGEIRIVTIPDMVAAVPNGRLFIAKVDIEGFESDLFAANTGWIDDIAVLIIELHDWMRPGGGTSFALQQAMAERRFEIVISGENLVYINAGLIDAETREG